MSRVTQPVFWNRVSLRPVVTGEAHPALPLVSSESFQKTGWVTSVIFVKVFIFCTNILFDLICMILALFCKLTGEV